MTKRLNSKHKVDRRLKVNLWGRPKSPFNTRAYGPGQHGQTRSSMIKNINNLIYRMEPNDKELRILSSLIGSLSKNKKKHN